MTDRWITVPNWQRFQHYGDRDPTWIKLYLELRDKDEWDDLSYAERGLLVSIWIAYATSKGVLPVSKLAQKCGHATRQSHMDSLLGAGFIELSASKPLALARSREKEVEEEESMRARSRAREGSANAAKSNSFVADLGRYTGCRLARGSHGSSYVPDPLGVTPPPPDWPYPRPTREDVAAALHARDG